MIQDIYPDILNSPQKQFRDARSQQENLSVIYQIPEYLYFAQYCMGALKTLAIMTNRVKACRGTSTTVGLVQKIAYYTIYQNWHIYYMISIPISIYIYVYISIYISI